MPRRAGMAFSFAIDPSSERPLHEQLYRVVRAAIVSGRLRSGESLPSTRALSLQLNVARNTVATAFEALASEGYLQTRQGARTVVADTLPEEAAVFAAAPAPRILDGARARLSRRGEVIVSARTPFPTTPGGRAFRLGLPALDAFPTDAWERALRRRWKRSSARLLADGDRRGYLPLREAIADYVSVARGVPSHPDRVIIVAGAQQAFTILAQVLLDPGDAVWVEDPGYSASLAAMLAAGAVAVPMPVDEHGANPGPAHARAPNARLAVVTPANQFPLGVPMSSERRRELLAWASRAHAWIVEDDYDGEFRYGDKPVPALAASSPGRVIYVGTFSKVLMPSLRLGYLVVPDALVDAVVAAKGILANRTPSLEQAVTSDFITSGEFLRHVRRMRVLYAKRCTSLARVAAEELGDAARLRPTRAGMQAILDVPSCASHVASRAAAVGVHVTPLSAFAVEARPAEALVLGFAAVPLPEQRRAARLLAGALEAP